MMLTDKRGISPVTATVILVAIAITAAAIATYYVVAIERMNPIYVQFIILSALVTIIGYFLYVKSLQQKLEKRDDGVGV